MKKDNYSTIIDFGSSEIRLGVFDHNLSKLFFQLKDISEKNNYEEYSKSINFLIREAEKKFLPILKILQFYMTLLKFILLTYLLKKN